MDGEHVALYAPAAPFAVSSLAFLVAIICQELETTAKKLVRLQKPCLEDCMRSAAEAVQVSSLAAEVALSCV